MGIVAMKQIKLVDETLFVPNIKSLKHANDWRIKNDGRTLHSSKAWRERFATNNRLQSYLYPGCDVSMNMVHVCN